MAGRWGSTVAKCDSYAFGKNIKNIKSDFGAHKPIKNELTYEGGLTKLCIDAQNCAKMHRIVQFMLKIMHL